MILDILICTTVTTPYQKGNSSNPISLKETPVIKYKGIPKDRHFGNKNLNISLISIDDVKDIVKDIDIKYLKRNVIAKDISFLNTIGKIIKIGSINIKIIDYLHICKNVQKFFHIKIKNKIDTKLCGVVGKVLNTGTICIGDKITIKKIIP